MDLLATLTILASFLVMSLALISLERQLLSMVEGTTILICDETNYCASLKVCCWPTLCLGEN